MVFQVKGRGPFKLRIVLDDGRSATLSTGMYAREDAAAVETQVERWKGMKGEKYARPDVLALIVLKKIGLCEAYEAQQGGTLQALVDAHKETPPAVPALDLWPHVAAWHAEKAKAKKGAASAEDYLRQLRTLYPIDAPFTLDAFTRKEVWSRIDALDVEDPTRNRYKAAVSAFAKYLLKRELLETNFTRDITGYAESDPRVVYYERRDAIRLIHGLDQPFAAAAAVACGFCAEWCAIADLFIEDVDLTKGLERCYVRGTKRSWRRRWVPLVPENRWVLPYIKKAVDGKLPGQRVFAGLREWVMLDAQRKRANELKIVANGEDQFGQHSIHDWRHTHIVQLLRDGYDEQIAAAHAGHKNTDLIRKVYGVFKPDVHDYARATKRMKERKAATNSATPLRND